MKLASFFCYIKRHWQLWICLVADFTYLGVANQAANSAIDFAKITKNMRNKTNI